MFTIKVSPKDHPFDVIAIAAEQYKKQMCSAGYNLWYTPYGKPEVWAGVGLFLGDVAYIENAAGKTIDKVEGHESNVAPLVNGDGLGVLSDGQSEIDAPRPLATCAFTQRSEVTE